MFHSQVPSDRIAQFDIGSSVLSPEGAAETLALLETPLLLAGCTSLDRVLAVCKRYDKKGEG